MIAFKYFNFNWQTRKWRQNDRYIRNFAEQSAIQETAEELTLFRVIKQITGSLQWIDSVWNLKAHLVSLSSFLSWIGSRRCSEAWITLPMKTCWDSWCLNPLEKRNLQAELLSIFQYLKEATESVRGTFYKGE